MIPVDYDEPNFIVKNVTFIRYITKKKNKTKILQNKLKTLREEYLSGERDLPFFFNSNSIY
jgi:hypothetical protein